MPGNIQGRTGFALQVLTLSHILILPVYLLLNCRVQLALFDLHLAVKVLSGFLHLMKVSVELLRQDPHVLSAQPLQRLMHRLHVLRVAQGILIGLYSVARLLVCMLMCKFIV